MHCVPKNTDVRCCSFHIYQLILIIQEYGVRWEIKMPFDSLFSLQCFCQRLAESDDLHTRARSTALFPGLPVPRVSRYQKGKTNLDFPEARDSEWHELGRMQVCTSLQTDNHTSNPPLSFLQAECPFWRPTNSVKALNGKLDDLCRSYSIRRECRFGGGDIV